MEELKFKRFSKDKQEQIRQFVSYAQMMGLTGKDIRSIGDKLDRDRKAEERKANMEAIKTFTCMPIGIDRDYGAARIEDRLDERFKLDLSGNKYKFEYDYGWWNITSYKTKQTIKHRPSYDYEIKNTNSWARGARWQILLDLYYGKINLNF